jgi:hypothetical protein
MTETAENFTGKTLNHWQTSTIIFSLIINLVVFKLFLETK